MTKKRKLVQEYPKNKTTPQNGSHGFSDASERPSIWTTLLKAFTFIAFLVVVGVGSFVGMVFFLNTENIQETKHTYLITDIRPEGDSYAISYHPLDDESSVESDVVDVEWQIPEEGSDASYFVVREYRDCSFANDVFHLNDEVTTETDYYLSSFDRMSLESPDMMKKPEIDAELAKAL